MVCGGRSPFPDDTLLTRCSHRLTAVLHINIIAFPFHSQGVSLSRVKSSGVRQSKIYTVTLGSKRVNTRGGGDFHMKGAGMLVISLRDVNFT